MAAPKLADEVGITLEEAEELLVRYKKAFPTVTKYLEESGEKAKQQLEVRTIAGRRRRWKLPTWARAKEIVLKECEKDKRPFSEQRVRRKYASLFGSIEREGKNAPIQGANADISKLAMIFAQESLFKDYGAYFINMVHDELVAECPEEHADACFKFISECMTLAGTFFLKRVLMPTEGHIEDYWTK